MNTKGIIWEPICMLNAGEGTFCNAEVRVMLQLSPTLSLRDWANAIVLPLCFYPFPFAISACLPSLLAPKPHLIPLFPPICQKPLYLHSTNSFHRRHMKCSTIFPSVVMKWEGEDKEGVTRERKIKRKREEEEQASESLTSLPSKCSSVPSPSAGEATCLHLTPFHLSLHLCLLDPSHQLSEQNTCVQAHNVHTQIETVTGDTVSALSKWLYS